MHVGSIHLFEGPIIPFGKRKEWSIRGSCDESEAREGRGQDHPHHQPISPLWLGRSLAPCHLFQLERMCHSILYLQGTRSSASVRHKGPSWNIHGIRFERGEKLDWWYVDSGYGAFANNSIIWNSCEKSLITRSKKFSRETANLYSHAGRAKSCKRDSR